MLNERNGRTISLIGEITMENIVPIINRILELEQENKTPIILQISSCGGDVDAGLTLIDIMQTIQSPIYTVGLGQCCSMASLILCAGKKGYRKVNKHCFILLHQVRGGINGQVMDIKSNYKEMINKNEEILKLYSDFTGNKKEIIREDLRNDFVLTANEAIEYGLIDEII